MRLGHDYAPRMRSAVSHRCRWVCLASVLRPRVLAASLGRFAADADTAPGLLERLRNRSARARCASPGDVAAFAVAPQRRAIRGRGWSIEEQACGVKEFTNTSILAGEPVSAVTKQTNRLIAVIPAFIAMSRFRAHLRIIRHAILGAGLYSLALRRTEDALVDACLSTAG